MGKLVLYSQAGAESDDLERALRDSEFISRPFEAAEGKRFRPGEMFPELLRFDPPRPPQRFTISIPEQRDEIDFLGSANVQAPSCACGTVFHDWSDRVDDWRTTHQEWRCGGCGTNAQPWAFNWNHTAGFGRCNVDVHGVDLGDATPSQPLLDGLEGVSGSKWDYFYSVE